MGRSDPSSSRWRATGRSDPSSSRWRAMGRPDDTTPRGGERGHNDRMSIRLSARSSHDFRIRGTGRGRIPGPCVEVAFQKVGNEAKIFVRDNFSANSRALRGQGLGVARMRVCCSCKRHVWPVRQRTPSRVISGDCRITQYHSCARALFAGRISLSSLSTCPPPNPSRLHALFKDKACHGKNRTSGGTHAYPTVQRNHTPITRDSPQQLPHARSTPPGANPNKKCS
jgi:hypothetical protein